jgi:hypothetical protein
MCCLSRAQLLTRLLPCFAGVLLQRVCGRVCTMAWILRGARNMQVRCDEPCMLGVSWLLDSFAWQVSTTLHESKQGVKSLTEWHLVGTTCQCGYSRVEGRADTVSQCDFGASLRFKCP